MTTSDHDAIDSLADEVKALADTVKHLAEFCASTAKIDKLHADALTELTQLVQGLHDRFLALERRFQENVTIDYTTPPGTFVRTEVIPASQNDPVISLKTPNWEKKP